MDLKYGKSKPANRFNFDQFLYMRFSAEMGQIDPKYKETSEQVRLKAILLTIKRYLYNHGVNMLEPLKDFDTFGEGRLNKSQTLRALHLLRISPGQRCDISDQDLDFLLNAYSTDGNFVDYKAMVTELSQGSAKIEKRQLSKLLSQKRGFR